MSAMTLDDKFVLLCDWRGKVVWGTATVERVRPGELAWTYLDEDSQSVAMDALARVASLGETQVMEVTRNGRERFRVWMWPLGAPDVAVCVMGFRVPMELAELTERERECLQYLAAGESTAEISRGLDISLSTVHTHLRKCREKLDLPTNDALIAFAARYCQPVNGSRRK